MFGHFHEFYNMLVMICFQKCWAVFRWKTRCTESSSEGVCPGCCPEVVRCYFCLEAPWSMSSSCMVFML